eukprot:COSAG02_NODE_3365_length_6867_cov_2.147163_1_plen_98_part_00
MKAAQGAQQVSGIREDEEFAFTFVRHFGCIFCTLGQDYGIVSGAALVRALTWRSSAAAALLLLLLLLLLRVLVVAVLRRALLLDPGCMAASVEYRYQ